MRVNREQTCVIDNTVIDRLLVAALRGDPACWPDEWSADAAVRKVSDRVAYHGIELALHHHRAMLEGWPDSLRDAIADTARLQVLWEESHRQLLCDLIARFAHAGIEVLVTKGTALAYSVYPDPALRRRGDSDLIVRPGQRRAARKLLRQAGLERSAQSTLQEDWSFDTGTGFVHVVDLHWQANSVAALRDIFTIEEAFARSAPLDALAPAARTLDPILLLLQDILNHALHVEGGYLVDGELVWDDNRLVWVWGVQLQADRFSPEQWEAFADEALARGMAQLCFAALTKAQGAFAVTVPESVVRRLHEGRSGAVDRYLHEIGPAGRLLANLRNSGRWGGRFGLLWRNLFPHRAFMRRKYPAMAQLPLPLLHCRRIAAMPLALFRRR